MSYRSPLSASVWGTEVTLVPFRSGAQKLQSFNVTTGGPVMSLMTPKMDTFLGHIKDASPSIDIPLEKVRGLPRTHASSFQSLYTHSCNLTCFTDAPTHKILRYRGLQEHYVLLLGAAIFLELAGAALFLANYSAGAYMLVRAHLSSIR